MLSIIRIDLSRIVYIVHCMSKRRQTLSEDLEKDAKASKMVLEPVKTVSWEGKSFHTILQLQCLIVETAPCNTFNTSHLSTQDPETHETTGLSQPSYTHR